MARRGSDAKGQRPWPLASMFPIAAITLAGHVQSRSSSRVRSPGKSTRTGCPAATDGLDGFRPALDNSAAGAWIPCD